MSSAIHIKTRVLPGKKIQVSSRSLVEGQPVDVFVISPPSRLSRRRSVLQMLKSTPAPGLFRTADEADACILRERDSWER